MFDKFEVIMRAHVRVGALSADQLSTYLAALPSTLGVGLARRVLLHGLLAVRGSLDAPLLTALGQSMPAPIIAHRTAHTSEPAKSTRNIQGLPLVVLAVTCQFLTPVEVVAVERSSRGMMAAARDRHAQHTLIFHRHRGPPPPLFTLPRPGSATGRRSSAGALHGPLLQVRVGGGKRLPVCRRS